MGTTMGDHEGGKRYFTGELSAGLRTKVPGGPNGEGGVAKPRSLTVSLGLRWWHTRPFSEGFVPHPVWEAHCLRRMASHQRPASVAFTPSGILWGRRHRIVYTAELAFLISLCGCWGRSEPEVVLGRHGFESRKHTYQQTAEHEAAGNSQGH